TRRCIEDLLRVFPNSIRKLKTRCGRVSGLHGKDVSTRGLHMEIFRYVHFDFLGRKWWFILPSLVLMLAGIASLIVNGGPQYSIDFLGGTMAEIRWEGAPPIEQIRAALSPKLRGVSVVAAHDLTGSNEVLVSAETPADVDVTALRQTIDEALTSAGGRYTIRDFEAIGP